jgi:hypothetical protein
MRQSDMVVKGKRPETEAGDGNRGCDREGTEEVGIGIGEPLVVLDEHAHGHLAGTSRYGQMLVLLQLLTLRLIASVLEPNLHL